MTTKKIKTTYTHKHSNIQAPTMKEDFVILPEIQDKCEIEFCPPKKKREFKT